MRKTALLLSLITVAALALPALAQSSRADFGRTDTRPMGGGDDDSDSNDPQPVIVVNLPDVQDVMGSVAVTNFPALQSVAGTVAVSNLPAVQTVAGSVEVTNLADIQLSEE